MNKKGFTLIELIAVVVIMSIIAVIATPNVINMMETGNNKKYISDASNFISKAKYMYNQEKYQDKFNKQITGEATIKLSEIVGITADDEKDPHGYPYDLEHSTVTIYTQGEDTLKERKAKITLISYKDEDCYTIDSVEESNLTVDQVKQGTLEKQGQCIVYHNSK